MKLKTLIFLLSMAFFASLVAKEVHTIGELGKKCAKEKEALKNSISVLDKTPWCDLLEKTRADKKKQEELNRNELIYQWHGGLQTYCFFNKAGDIVSCP